LAASRRSERDRLILRLRAEDPGRWSYTALADALGCSRELIALVLRRNA
jgi:biotin operon repressor